MILIKERCFRERWKSFLEKWTVLVAYQNGYINHHPVYHPFCETDYICLSQLWLTALFSCLGNKYFRADDNFDFFLLVTVWTCNNTPQHNLGSSHSCLCLWQHQCVTQWRRWLLWSQSRFFPVLSGACGLGCWRRGESAGHIPCPISCYVQLHPCWQLVQLRPHSPARPNKLGKFPHTVPTLLLLHWVMLAIST